ncbi:thiamine-phosphate pyrophosphorylase [Catenuloplanes nepalensis]|uniref:Thiamine-phosphate synthase n=1 Tax=Catenuloplanes nepalensis TaxID=587533 RepID=A0ABT9N6V3_9ACTN|nr:thiamine-phosphate pyrophosphorylase [Catenuloplanes nepalensis]
MDATLGRLHLITDTRPGRDPIGCVRAALAAHAAADDVVRAAAGPLVVQVRVEDDATDLDAYQLAVRVRELCAAAGAICLVNDRLHVALAIGADGGHVGALDLPVAAARRVLGPRAILGATARVAGTGSAAVEAGASYLGVGPCYATTTKDGLPALLGPAGLGAVATAVPVPVIAIAGVTRARVAELLAAGAYGVAVVGAVSGAADPGRAVAELLRELAGAVEPADQAPHRAGPEPTDQAPHRAGPEPTVGTTHPAGGPADPSGGAALPAAGTTDAAVRMPGGEAERWAGRGAR